MALGTFEAKYRTLCAHCGHWIEPGDEAHYVVAAVEHITCPLDALEPQREPCPRCFLELPVSGVCGSC